MNVRELLAVLFICVVAVAFSVIESDPDAVRDCAATWHREIEYHCLIFQCELDNWRNGSREWWE